MFNYWLKVVITHDDQSLVENACHWLKMKHQLMLIIITPISNQFHSEYNSEQASILNQCHSIELINTNYYQH